MSGLNPPNIPVLPCACKGNTLTVNTTSGWRRHPPQGTGAILNLGGTVAITGLTATADRPVVTPAPRRPSKPPRTETYVFREQNRATQPERDDSEWQPDLKQHGYGDDGAALTIGESDRELRHHLAVAGFNHHLCQWHLSP